MMYKSLFAVTIGILALFSGATTHAQGGRWISGGLTHAASYEEWHQSLKAELESQNGCLAEAVNRRIDDENSIIRELQQAIAAHEKAKSALNDFDSDIGGWAEDIGKVVAHEASLGIISEEMLNFRDGTTLRDTANHWETRVKKLDLQLQKFRSAPKAFVAEYVRRCLAEGEAEMRGLELEHQRVQDIYHMADRWWIPVKSLMDEGKNPALFTEWTQTAQKYFSKACQAEVDFHAKVDQWGSKHFWEMRYSTRTPILPPEPKSLIHDYELEKRRRGVKALIQAMRTGDDSPPTGENRPWPCP